MNSDSFDFYLPDNLDVEFEDITLDSSDINFLRNNNLINENEFTKLKVLLNKLKDKSLCLDDEVKMVAKYIQFLWTVKSNFNELKVETSYNMGKLLVVHRTNFYESRIKQPWRKWISEHISWLKDDKRQNLELLGHRGHLFKKFFILGEVALCDLIRAMIDVVDYDKTMMQEAFKTIGYSFSFTPESPEEIYETKQKIQQVIQYFYFVKHAKDLQSIQDKVVSAIKVGCKFTAKEIKEINKLSLEEKDEKFTKSIATGTSQELSFQPVDSYESIDALLAKLIEILKINKDNDKLTESVDFELLTEAANLLNSVKMKLEN